MNNSIERRVLSLKKMCFDILTTLDKERELSFLQLACIEGDIETVSSILNCSPDKLDSAIALSIKIGHNSPHFAGKSISTAFNQQDSAEHTEISELVEKAIEDFKSRSLIHIAATKGHLEHLRRLLDCGEKVDSMMPDRSMVTPLMLAARHNETDVVEFLVRRGASLKRRDRRGHTSFHYAVMGGKTRNVLRLIELGSNALAENSNQRSAVHLAAENGHTEIVRLLLKQPLKCRADVNKVDAGDVTPLMLAAQSGNLETILLLLENGAILDTTDCTGWLPLHHAAAGNNADVVKFFVESNGNVLAKTSDLNRSVLHLATCLEAVSYLVEQGADIHARTYDQQTPLHAAAKDGQSDTVDYLLNHGADINSRDGSGFSALLYALREGHATTARVFINRGYDFKLTHPRSKENAVIFVSAAKLGLTDFLQRLLDIGFDVDRKSTSGKTALITAAEAGEFDTVAFLLRRGANVNAKAVSFCRRWCAECHRCNVCEDGSGIRLLRRDRVISPLYSALKTGHGRVAKLLIERGAYTFDPRDKNVSLAFVKFATKYGLSDVLQLLTYMDKLD